MAAAAELARFVSRLRFARLPPAVAERARLHIQDTIGVGVAGARAGAPDFGAIAQHLGGRGGATVWGRGLRLPPGAAALLNGMAAHSQDFDDTHSAAIVHGSACIVPAALALAEAVHSPGQRLITAVVAGWEVAARVGLAAPGRFHARGFHTTSVAGVFGAAAAASVILELDGDGALNALALAGSMVCGINEYLANGSNAKVIHPGLAAQGGVQAALLAQAGLGGPDTVFEGRFGLLRAYAAEGGHRPGALTDGLGQRWEILEVSLKPYPFCHFAHACVDAALELRRAHGLSAGQVGSVLCRVPPETFPLICDPWEVKQDPPNEYIARFSLPYLVATALCRGAVGPDSFTPERLRDPSIRALMQRVSYEAWEGSPFPSTFPGWVIVRTADGQVLEVRREVNRGNPREPLTRGEVEAKFSLCVAGLGPQPAQELVRALRELPTLPDVSRLAGLAGGRAAAGKRKQGT